MSNLVFTALSISLTALYWKTLGAGGSGEAAPAPSVLPISHLAV